MEQFEGDLRAFITWWCSGGRKVRRRSTVVEYVRHLRRWMSWQQEQPGDLSCSLTLRSVRAYLAEVRDGSAWNAYSATKALKAWSRFLVDEGELEVDPLAKLANLAQPETAKTPVAELADIQAILDTCDGPSMEDARDAAIISMLRCTGMRRGELIALTWADINFSDSTVVLRNETVKNGRGRTVAFDRATRRALKVYRRRIDERELHRCRDLTSWHNQLWVSKNGLMTASAVSQMLQRRSALAGVKVPAHSFRRSLAVRWLRAGGSEAHLMTTAGWSNSSMVRRYTSAVAGQEALAAQRALQAGEAAARERRKSLAS